jgi:phenylpropionate dioxygenase-like ring-hydroxylating dioxygenase large terminal subunit
VSSRFPFPIPFGWFKVAEPGDVAPGQILTKRYFGTELVLWREQSGALHCHEAYCAHLGAHLGDGQVAGDCIRCPFHGWSWDGDGANTDIPYADRPNPKARLRTFPIHESNGLVFAWYHPDPDQAPLYDVFEVEETRDPAYGLHSTHTYEVATCLQEMAENGYDAGHFEAVHSHPRAGVIEEVSLDGFDRVMRSSQEFPSKSGTPRPGRIDVFGRGPGFSVTRYEGPITAALLGASTPIDAEHTQLWFHFYLRDPGNERSARVAEAFVSSVSREVGQDIPIWEAKRYVPRPQLAPGEAPILEFRRWFAQFYAEPQPAAV